MIKWILRGKWKAVSIDAFFFLCVLETVAVNEHNRTLHANERARTRRQFDARHGPHIDLNITVPYIFSARLYPYGLAKGDQLAHMDPQPIDLHSPLKFFGESYQTIFIHRDGVIAVSPSASFLPAPPQNQMPLIAVYWMPSSGGRVFYRETTGLIQILENKRLNSSIINLVQSEVNIQYRYGSAFKPKSVLIVTWEGTNAVNNPKVDNSDGNTFQIALILGERNCFAHIVYSRLRTNNNAAAGFSGAPGNSIQFSLPGSGTSDAMQLMEKSNIGIPGEWLFRIDEEQIYLCGAGFQGIECVDPCSPTQWYLDCSRSCHCVDGVACDVETGACPSSQCSPGWEGSPICDQDVNECESETNLCPAEQPDCVNTPGAYLCLCFEYDNRTNTCKGSLSALSSEQIPVHVMPLVPQIMPKPKPSRKEQSINERPSARFVEPTTQSTPLPIPMQTLEPLTIRPLLHSRRVSVQPPCPKCDPNAKCVNSECICNSGWTGNGLVCTDLNECSMEGICGSNAECYNSPGSYQCQCSSGFVATPTGCVDVDECSEGIVVCAGGNTSVCVNKPGGFECQCARGFAGRPDSQEGCIDINECDIPEFHCGNKAKCRNTAGSFECECFEGYERAHNSSQCVDVNECLLSPCDMSAICTNLDGTFRCQCVDGYVGNGVECKETILFPTGHNATTLPSVQNAVIPFRLEMPINLFGHSYETAYVSANGVISFDRAFSEMSSHPREIRSTAIFPFLLTNNMQSGGVVSVRQVTELDASNYGLLTRTSLIVQSKFNLKKFQALSLLIVTYDKVTALHSSRMNTFQCVIAHSADFTFVLFLYEHLEDEHPSFVGITHPNGFTEVPSSYLISQSNIGQPGKWMFQIDKDGNIGLCPSGKIGPPLCQKDCTPGTWGFDCANTCHCANNMPCDFVSGFCSNGQCSRGYTGHSCMEDLNECLSPTLNRCHPNATCLNTVGSYDCRCRERFYGDGFTCNVVNGCYRRFGRECTKNAYCDETNAEYPECVCMENFHGDGRRVCYPDVNTNAEATTIRSNTITNPRQRVIISNGKSSEASDEQPFLMNPWRSSENAESAPTFTISPKIQSSQTRITMGPTKPTISTKTIIESEEDAIEFSGVDSQTTPGYEDSNERMLFYLILPSVFIGIWFVLMIIIIVICCRRRRRSRANKYSPQMMGWTPRNYTSTRSNYFSQSTMN
ncbi:EGF-like domain-containing protein [Aphelenchoides besseyi]|nr:EGF-like domain-containing protein [Aphelenchoides besseyi]